MTATLVRPNAPTLTQPRESDIVFREAPSESLDYSVHPELDFLTDEERNLADVMAHPCAECDGDRTLDDFCAEDLIALSYGHRIKSRPCPQCMGSGTYLYRGGSR